MSSLSDPITKLVDTYSETSKDFKSKSVDRYKKLQEDFSKTVEIISEEFDNASRKIEQRAQEEDDAKIVKSGSDFRREIDRANNRLYNDLSNGREEAIDQILTDYTITLRKEVTKLENGLKDNNTAYKEDVSKLITAALNQAMTRAQDLKKCRNKI